ncbi:hypothetical protein LshimejAT787_0705520 [Lyophyllum shimeji]|uniref:Protein kinase domain-containing protein n=1 Tax=Lyophyllum shimeji TaxID=47721 RepID=A0A9P3PP47_LYOSH|nr:hypothetical protein LshimejAT787_0705520 [Lyophyllum shimeji]
MPVDQFLHEFMPPLPSDPKLPKLSNYKGHFNKMPVVKLENDMYKPFIDLIQCAKHDLIPGYKLVNTAHSYDKDMGDGRKIKPDPSMYKASVDTSSKRTQFGELELHFELKPDTYSDPFDDPASAKVDRTTHKFDASPGKRSNARSQLIHYVTEWCSRQHRRFAFTVFVGDPYVRFIRWDRAGAIVSEKFNYREDSRPLIQFLWRFSHRDDVTRGKDPTVRRANPQEVKLAHEHLSEWDPKAERPVVVFEVPGEDGRVREFIAWGSVSRPCSLTGRCTRAYPVYERASGKRYFLNDTWRAYDLAQEAHILRELQAAGVEHVPPFVCGGDLPDAVTMTDLYVPDDDDKAQSGDGGDKPGNSEAPKKHEPLRPKRNAPWRCGSNWRRVTQRFHHRFVVDFIGKHLNQFANSKQLMQVVSDAFKAHQQAYQRCKIIHRDISSNNILIDDTGRGILNDWDLAKHESELAKGRRHERTGTWEFMSCLLLTSHHSIHTIQDDMESFVHIVLYHALRYLPHNQPLRIVYIMDGLFHDQNLLPDGSYLGGEGKKSMFITDAFVGPDLQFSPEPLHGWMRWAFAAVRQWINRVNPAPANHDNALSFGAAHLKGASLPTPPAAATPSTADCVLHDHNAMAAIFDYALSLEWPNDDRPIDALATQASAQAAHPKNSSKRSLASGEVGGDDSERGSKRSKTSLSAPAPRQNAESSRRTSARLQTRRSKTTGSGRV